MEQVSELELVSSQDIVRSNESSYSAQSPLVRLDQFKSLSLIGSTSIFITGIIIGSVLIDECQSTIIIDCSVNSSHCQWCRLLFLCRDCCRSCCCSSSTSSSSSSCCCCCNRAIHILHVTCLSSPYDIDCLHHFS